MLSTSGLTGSESIIFRLWLNHRILHFDIDVKKQTTTNRDLNWKQEITLYSTQEYWDIFIFVKYTKRATTRHFSRLKYLAPRQKYVKNIFFKNDSVVSLFHQWCSYVIIELIFAKMVKVLFKWHLSSLRFNDSKIKVPLDSGLLFSKQIPCIVVGVFFLNRRFFTAIIVLFSFLFHKLGSPTTFQPSERSW